MIGTCCTYKKVDTCLRRLFYVTGRVVKCAVLGRPGMLSKLVEWCESSRSVVRCFSCSRKLSEGQEWNCVIARSPTNHNSGPLRFGRLLVWKDVCRSYICVSVPSIYGTETHMMKMRYASLNACFRNTALNPTSGGIHNDATHVQNIRRFPYEMLVVPSSSRL